MAAFGKLLVIFGAIAMLIGALIWAGFGNWIGRLPGDIRIERGNSGFYFPIVTCVIISIVLTVLMSLFRR
jgi:tellurite resistance protein TehA-like permease